MMAGKRKKRKEKSRCSNDGDFGLRGRRFWRDENDGDSVPMTESWQVWFDSIHKYTQALSNNMAARLERGLTSFCRSCIMEGRIEQTPTIILTVGTCRTRRITLRAPRKITTDHDMWPIRLMY